MEFINLKHSSEKQTHSLVDLLIDVGQHFCKSWSNFNGHILNFSLHLLGLKVSIIFVSFIWSSWGGCCAIFVYFLAQYMHSILCLIKWKYRQFYFSKVSVVCYKSGHKRYTDLHELILIQHEIHILSIRNKCKWLNITPHVKKSNKYKTEITVFFLHVQQHAVSLC